MTALGIFAIRLNVVNLDRAAQFYTSIGMIEDIGMRRADSSPAAPMILGLDDPSARPGARSMSLRWPCDPYMHINLVSMTEDSPRSGWPKTAGQFGSTVVTLRVTELDQHIAQLAADGMVILSPPTATIRNLGQTRSAFVLDSDSNIVELVEPSYEAGWDTSTCSVVGADRTFLHMQLNTENLEALSAFYASFGFQHDSGVDPRPGSVPYETDGDPYLKAFGVSFKQNRHGVSFFRLPGETSDMHLEVMGWKPGALLDPTDVPTFHQRGVMRYCFKVRELDKILAEQKRRGAKILQEGQGAPLNWGDSEWFFTADPDGNVLCFEEWHGRGYRGARN
jgi:predicted enzyme related to lactoylglutathione lyase